MKKIFGILLILALGLFAVTGCQQATSTTPTEAPEGAGVAGSVGGLMGLSTSVDTIATSSMGISSVVAGAKAMEVTSAPVYNASTGWWTFSVTSDSIPYSFKAKAYDSSDEPISEEANLGLTNKLLIVASATLGSSMSYNFGTEASPLTFTGISTGSKGLSGTINVTVTADGHSYVLQVAYSGVTLDTAGIPADGSATFTFTSNDYVEVDATLTFNGGAYPNETATLTFTAPTELATTEYTINLVSGTATLVPASL